jgi:hypothetical protein
VSRPCVGIFELLHTWGERAEPLGRAKPYKISELQRDTKISRFLLARNRKFESISLQRRVRSELRIE